LELLVARGELELQAAGGWGGCFHRALVHDPSILAEARGLGVPQRPPACASPAACKAPDGHAHKGPTVLSIPSCNSQSQRLVARAKVKAFCCPCQVKAFCCPCPVKAFCCPCQRQRLLLPMPGQGLMLPVPKSRPSAAHAKVNAFCCPRQSQRLLLPMPK